jgi:Cu/Ag efflux protein CusF
MKNFRFALIFFLLFAPSLYSCQEGTDVVESGTYQGTIKEVEPDKTEIYVNTEDGKTLELYFTDATTLTQNGQTVPFEQLKEGNRVEVQVEKVGQRLDPVAVRILE